MTEFLRWLTITHSQRLHAHRHTTGYGHIYQGRFKSFPIEQDESLLNVPRYVERNALRANLVERAQDCRWCSLSRRLYGDGKSLLSGWPVDAPANWVDWVNGAETASELEALRNSVNRGTPYGTEEWTMGSQLRSGWNLLFVHVADLEKRCVEHQKRFAAGWPRAVILPGLPQTRTCIFDAYGSSGHGLAAR